MTGTTTTRSGWDSDGTPWDQTLGASPHAKVVLGCNPPYCTVDLTGLKEDVLYSTWCAVRDTWGNGDVFPKGRYGLQARTRAGPQLIGCYADDMHKRDLPVLMGTGLGPFTCANLCFEYRYFGLQSKGDCYCSDSYGQYGTAPFRNESLGGCDCDGPFYGTYSNCVWRQPPAPPAVAGLIVHEVATRSAQVWVNVTAVAKVQCIASDVVSGKLRESEVVQCVPGQISSCTVSLDQLWGGTGYDISCMHYRNSSVPSPPVVAHIKTPQVAEVVRIADSNDGVVVVELAVAAKSNVSCTAFVLEDGAPPLTSKDVARPATSKSFANEMCSPPFCRLAISGLQRGQRHHVWCAEVGGALLPGRDGVENVILVSAPETTGPPSTTQARPSLRAKVDVVIPPQQSHTQKPKPPGAALPLVSALVALVALIFSSLTARCRSAVALNASVSFWTLWEVVSIVDFITGVVFLLELLHERGPYDPQWDSLAVMTAGSVIASAYLHGYEFFLFGLLPVVLTWFKSTDGDGPCTKICAGFCGCFKDYGGAARADRRQSRKRYQPAGKNSGKKSSSPTAGELGPSAWEGAMLFLPPLSLLFVCAAEPSVLTKAASKKAFIRGGLVWIEDVVQVCLCLVHLSSNPSKSITATVCLASSVLMLVCFLSSISGGVRLKMPSLLGSSSASSSSRASRLRDAGAGEPAPTQLGSQGSGVGFLQPDVFHMHDPQ